MYLKVEGDLLDGKLGKSPPFIGGFSSTNLFYSLLLHFPVHQHNGHSVQLEVLRLSVQNAAFDVKTSVVSE